MTVQFNPPPGWHVPTGWMPPFGWKKPKEWPDAPVGWEFYLELPYTSEMLYSESKMIEHSSTNTVNTNIVKENSKKQKVEHQPWWPWDDPNSRFFNPTPTKKITFYKIIFISIIALTLIFMGISTFIFFKTHNSDNISAQILEKCYTDVRQQISAKVSPLNINSNNVLLTLGTTEQTNVGFNNNIDNTERIISGTGKGTQNPSYSWYCQFDKTTGTWEYKNSYILAQK